MQESLKQGDQVTPVLFSIGPSQFWAQIRVIIREEVQKLEIPSQAPTPPILAPRLTYKSLLKIGEFCQS